MAAVGSTAGSFIGMTQPHGPPVTELGPHVRAL